MRSLFGARSRRARSSIVCAAALVGLLVGSLTPAAVASQPGEPAAPQPPVPPPAPAGAATPHVDAQGRPVDIHTPFHVTKVAPGKDDAKGWKPKSGQATAAAAVSSAPLSPPFTECPAVGLDTSCQFLVVIDNGSHVSILQDPSQGHYDVGGDDSLVGIVNNSPSPVASVSLTSDGPIFKFDGDGICTVSPQPTGCPFGPTGYEGPATSFSAISADFRTGKVNFGPALATGAVGYFGLEDSPAAGAVSALDTLGAGNPSEDNHQCAKGPYPVNCATGNFWHTFSDRVVPGRGPGLDLERTYNSLDAATDGPFGFGWSSTYAVQVTVDDTAAATVHQENGAQVRFVPTGRSTYAAPARVFATLGGGGFGAFSFVRRQRETMQFAYGRLLSIRDLNGYTTTVGYANGRLATATDPAGRTLSFGYGASGRVESVTDPAGYVLHYAYDAAGNLVSSTDVRGQMTRYTYCDDLPVPVASHV